MTPRDENQIAEHEHAAFSSESGDGQGQISQVPASACVGRQKIVSFSVEEQTIEVDLDPKLRKYRWYQKKDYVAFQEDRKETLRHLRERQASFQGIDEDQYCLRGFEAFLSPRAVQQKTMRRLSAIETVLNLQMRQQRKGVQRPKKMQTEYYRVTASSRIQAQERAILDALEAERCNNDADMQEESKPSRSEFNSVLLKVECSGSLVPSLRSGGPLRLCKTVPSSA